MSGVHCDTLQVEFMIATGAHLCVCLCVCLSVWYVCAEDEAEEDELTGHSDPRTNCVVWVGVRARARGCGCGCAACVMCVYVFVRLYVCARCVWWGGWVGWRSFLSVCLSVCLSVQKTTKLKKMS